MEPIMTDTEIELAEPPAGSIVAAFEDVWHRTYDDSNGAVWQKPGDTMVYGWANVVSSCKVVTRFDVVRRGWFA